MPEIKYLAGLGILTWLIPFLASILFYGPGGVLIIGYDLFKSLMVVIGSGIGAILLVLYFRHIKDNWVYEAWLVGVIWLILNWILDLIFLLPLSGQPVDSYFMAIGLRYLALPFMSLAIGYSLEYHRTKTVDNN